MEFACIIEIGSQAGRAGILTSVMVYRYPLHVRPQTDLYGDDQSFCSGVQIALLFCHNQRLCTVFNLKFGVDVVQVPF